MLCKVRIETGMFSHNNTLSVRNGENDERINDERAALSLFIVYYLFMVHFFSVSSFFSSG